MALKQTLMCLPGLLAGITVHECAHAWSASLLGDGLARRLGRVSLNPLRHLSPLGTLCMLLLPFGWGKPVYINLYNFRHPRRDYLLSSLAGPAANLLMVALCLALMQITRRSFDFGPHAVRFMTDAHIILIMAVIVNAILAGFNLIPIPPLDGSKIWPLISSRVKPTFSPSLRKASWIIVIVLIGTRVLDPAIGAVVTTLAKAMPTPAIAVFGRQMETAMEALKSGDYAGCEKALDEAIAVNPRSAECFLLRSSAREAQEKWQPALDDIRRAMDLDKDNAAEYKKAETEILKRMPPPL